MILSFIKPENFINTQEENFDSLVRKILYEFDHQLPQSCINGLYNYFKKIITFFPAAMGNNNMLIHLSNEEVHRTKIIVARNNKLIHVTEKSDTKFNMLLLLISSSESVGKYAKLKGRIIRLMEYKEINEALRSDMSANEIISLMHQKESELIHAKF